MVAKGGTMRLGAYDCTLKAGSLAQKLYAGRSSPSGTGHRYEVNNALPAPLRGARVHRLRRERAARAGRGDRAGGDPYFLGCQFHPEFQSKPFQPHPLFSGFVRAALEQRARQGRGEKPGEPPRPTPDIQFPAGAPKAQA